LERLLQSGSFIILCYGLAAVCACGLQLVPYLGWVALAMWGPLWVGYLVHFMLLHLAGGAIVGGISRAWLMIPIAYYGGGFALHWVSLNRAHAEANAIEQAAQKATIKVDQPFSFLNEAGAGGFELLKHYRVDRAFIRQAQGRITTQYLARGEACNDGIRSGSSAPRGRSSLLVNLFHGDHDKDKTRRCILSQEDLPASWRYRIERRDLPKGDVVNARFGSRYSVIDETTGAAVLTVETGTIGTLPLVQTVMVVCSLYSGLLKCDFGLERDPTRVPIGYKLLPASYSPLVESEDPDTWEIGILARALSLEPRTRAD
jgi:hypothetical protein